MNPEGGGRVFGATYKLKIDGLLCRFCRNGFPMTSLGLMFLRSKEY